MTLEQRMERLEKRNRRLTAALTLTVVAMCAVVTMAATGEQLVSKAKIGNFDMVMARMIVVENDAGKSVVSLAANSIGDGSVSTRSAKGNETNISKRWGGMATAGG